jgi:hypothetical protein
MTVNAKMIPVEIVLAIRGGGMGNRSRESKFRYDVFEKRKRKMEREGKNKKGERL